MGHVELALREADGTAGVTEEIPALRVDASASGLRISGVSDGGALDVSLELQKVAACDRSARAAFPDVLAIGSGDPDEEEEVVGGEGSGGQFKPLRRPTTRPDVPRRGISAFLEGSSSPTPAPPTAPITRWRRPLPAARGPSPPSSRLST